MFILRANSFVLWLLLMLEPALGDWLSGDWMILLNAALGDLDKVLEFNTASDYPANPHPVFMADDPGTVVLGTWDYWYISNNSDNSYKIYNAYNGYALDQINDTLPILHTVDNSKVQGWLIEADSDDNTFAIYNHQFERYLGLVDGGWPEYMDSSTASYTKWSFLPAISTSTVTETSIQMVTSTLGGASSTTVTRASITDTSTVLATTTEVRSHPP